MQASLSGDGNTEVGTPGSKGSHFEEKANVRPQVTSHPRWGGQEEPIPPKQSSLWLY